MRCKLACMSIFFASGLYGESHTARWSEIKQGLIRGIELHFSMAMLTEESFSMW